MTGLRGIFNAMPSGANATAIYYIFANVFVYMWVRRPSTARLNYVVLLKLRPRRYIFLPGKPIKPVLYQVKVTSRGFDQSKCGSIAYLTLLCIGFGKVCFFKRRYCICDIFYFTVSILNFS